MSHWEMNSGATLSLLKCLQTRVFKNLFPNSDGRNTSEDTMYIIIIKNMEAKSIMNNRRYSMNFN